MRGIVLAALSWAVWLFAASSPALAAPPLKVQIASCAPATVTGFIGPARNSDAPGDMRQFLGIPYAAPPTGANRWEPPKPAPCWTGDLAVQWPGKSCPQGATLDPWEDEDCLFLNVFTKSTGSATGRPVMVWIHGGGLISGSGSFQLNPYLLVQKDVIVVTINYRIGALGFLAHSALAHASGNFGLLDQQAALKWVRTNIRAFGGDPANITIFGGSAGGLSVLVHLVSPPTPGVVFHKAIIQSGAFYHQATPLSQAQQKGNMFATSAGCSSAACLRGLSVNTILAKQAPPGQPMPLGQSVALVTQDDLILKDTLKNRLLKGRFKKIPTMVGSSHDETRFHLAGNQAFGTGSACNFVSNVTPANYAFKLQSTGVPGNMTATIQGHYPPGSTPKSANEALAKQWTDSQYSCRTFRVNKWMAQNGGINFAYEFNDANAPPTAFPPFKLSDGTTFSYGAYHGAEGPFMWRMPSTNMCPGNTPPDNKIPALTPMQKHLSAAFVTYWTNFAKTGNPNNGVLPNWPEFTATNGKLASFKGTGLVLLDANKFDGDHKCSSFWDANSP